MWSSSSAGQSQGLLPLRSVGALFLLVTCPLAVLFLVRWGAPSGEVGGLQYVGHGGDFPKAIKALWHEPTAELTAFVLPLNGEWNEATLLERFEANLPMFVEAATLLAVFVAFQIALLQLVPGSVTDGPVSPSGHVPRYTRNGLVCYCITLLAFEYLVSNGAIDGEVVMRLYPWMIVVLNVAALLLCAALLVKGLTCPSTPDHGSSGNWIIDAYWGTELYPRILGIDVKTMTNCRFGMMAWALCFISMAHFNAKINGSLNYDMAASCFLLVFYLGKFFLWEHHYMRTMDIAHDRAGFYICWGCLVWVQTVYVTPAYHFAYQQTDSVVALVGNSWAPYLTAAIIVFGMAMVYLNYEADRQRMHARESKGRGMAWGHRYETVTASYTTEDGMQRTSLLLTSHLWGPARHFHYVFEVAAAVAWSVPLSASALPHVYWVFLTVLLLDRAVRDDARCAAKYGETWKRRQIDSPWLVIPGIF